MRMKGRGIMITVYTKTQCPKCVLTKRYLTQHHIPFEEKNIEEDVTALEDVKALGYKEVPVVQLDNGDHFSGFQPDRLAKVNGAL